jgi:hypothetical protein
MRRAAGDNDVAPHVGAYPDTPSDTFSPPEAVGLRASATEGGQMSRRTKRTSQAHKAEAWRATLGG